MLTFYQAMLFAVDSQPEMIVTQGIRVWYTSYIANTIGSMDSTAAANTKIEIAHGTGTLPTCIPESITPFAEGSLEMSAPAPFTLSAVTPYVTLMDAEGWQIHEVPGDSSPWGIAYNAGKVWVVDNGSQKLIEVGAPPVTAALTLNAATPATFYSVGDEISYSYLLTNSGTDSLIAPFSVTDNKTTVTCPVTPISLAPGERITCIASYSITQANLDAGRVTNTATGHGYFETTLMNSNMDSVSVTLSPPNFKVFLPLTLR